MILGKSRHQESISIKHFLARFFFNHCIQHTHMYISTIEYYWHRDIDVTNLKPNIFWYIPIDLCIPIGTCSIIKSRLLSAEHPRIWCTNLPFTFCLRPWRLHWNAGISTVDSYSPPQKKQKRFHIKVSLLQLQRIINHCFKYPSKNIFRGFQIILNRPLKKAHPLPLVFFFDHYCVVSEVVAPGIGAPMMSKKTRYVTPKS